MNHLRCREHFVLSEISLQHPQAAGPRSFDAGGAPLWYADLEEGTTSALLP